MVNANEAMRTAQLAADMIQDMDEDGEMTLTIVSSAPDVPLALIVELESGGL